MDSSIKGSARGKRGSGAGRSVSSQKKIPTKWLDFLRVADNKVELCTFLNDVVVKSTLPEWKEIHLESQQSMVPLKECVQMPNCLRDAAKNGCKNSSSERRKLMCYYSRWTVSPNQRKKSQHRALAGGHCWEGLHYVHHQLDK